MSGMQPTIRTRILVREIMNSPVILSGPDEAVSQIARKMSDFRVGSVVITESDRPVGIVTDGDIVTKVVAKDLRPRTVLARKIMTQPLHTIDGGKDVTDAARTMRKLKVKRLGVTYRQKLVGIVSISDLSAVTPELVDLISEKALIMRGELRRQRGYLAGYCDSCTQWSDYLLESDGKFLCDECRGETPGET